jgi:hypothetical protein
VKGSSLASRPDFLICPLCEVDHLQPSGSGSARCASCARLVGGAIDETLRRIPALPDAWENTAASAATPRCGACPTGSSTARPAARRYLRSILLPLFRGLMSTAKRTWQAG